MEDGTRGEEPGATDREEVVTIFYPGPVGGPPSVPIERRLRWRQSKLRGEPAYAVLDAPLPREAAAVVIRDPIAEHSRLVVVGRPGLDDSALYLGRGQLTQSEIREPNVSGRVELWCWLDGRVESRDAIGVRRFREQWCYIGGHRAERTAELLAALTDDRFLSLPGLGTALFVPGYLYPRRRLQTG